MSRDATLVGICQTKVMDILSQENLGNLTIERADQIASILQGIPASLIKELGGRIWDRKPNLDEPKSKQWSAEYCYCMFRSFHQGMRELHLPILKKFPYYDLLAQHPEEGNHIEYVTVGAEYRHDDPQNKIRKADSVWMKSVGPLVKKAKHLIFVAQPTYTLARDKEAKRGLIEFFRSFTSLEKVQFESDSVALDLMSIGLRESQHLKDLKFTLHIELTMYHIVTALKYHLRSVETLEIICPDTLALSSQIATMFTGTNVKKFKLTNDVETTFPFVDFGRCPRLDRDTDLRILFEGFKTPFAKVENLDLGSFSLDNWNDCLHPNVWSIVTELCINISSDEFASSLTAIGNGMPNLDDFRVVCYNGPDTELLGTKDKDIEAIKCLGQITFMGLAVYKAKSEVLETVLKFLPNMESLYFKSKFVENVSNVGKWLSITPENLKWFRFDTGRYNSPGDPRIDLSRLEARIRAKCQPSISRVHVTFDSFDKKSYRDLIWAIENNLV